MMSLGIGITSGGSWSSGGRVVVVLVDGAAVVDFAVAAITAAVTGPGESS